MQMKTQNRTLLVVVGFALLILFGILYQQGVFERGTKPGGIEVTDENKNNLPEPQQEMMGDPVKDPATLNQISLDDQKMFQLILTDLSNCFDLKTTSMVDSSPVTIESILSHTQEDLGPTTRQVDRWMNWHLHAQGGAERRIRMELNELDGGKVVRLLKYFAVDKEGLPIPVEIPAEKSDNPSDEVVNQMLKEGDVFYKEKAATAHFSAGEHIDYIEKNGTLAEFEFQKADRYFRCQNFKSRESCQCVR